MRCFAMSSLRNSYIYEYSSSILLVCTGTTLNGYTYRSKGDRPLVGWVALFNCTVSTAWQILRRSEDRDVSHMEKTKFSKRNLFGKPGRKRPLGTNKPKQRIILKWILMAWSWFSWLRLGQSSILMYIYCHVYVYDFRRGFGLDVGFVGYFNTHLVITLNYIATAISTLYQSL